MRIAHLSDFHLAQPPRLRQYNGKRFLGRLNWLLFRSRRHQPRRIKALIQSVVKAKPDLLAITGDIGQMGLAQEFKLARQCLEPVFSARIPALLVRGNHDLYGREVEADRTFSELQQDLRQELPPGAFLDFEECQILAMDQAVATPLFMAFGQAPEPLLNGLKERLPANPTKPRIALGHFPFLRPGGEGIPPGYGLKNAPALKAFLETHQFTAYLCGHIHKQFEIGIAPGLTQYCAGSASIETCWRLYTVERGALRSSMQSADQV